MERIILPAKIEMLDSFLCFIRGFCDKNGLAEERKCQMELACEEALVNVISYAYRGGEGSIEVICEIEGDRIAVTVADEGVEFDLMAHPEPDVNLAAEHRQIGGLGIHFIRTTMDQVTYRREGGRNILKMCKLLQKSGNPQIPEPKEGGASPHEEDVQGILQRQVEDLQRMSVIGRLVISQIDLKSVLSLVIEKSKEICRAEAGSLFLLSEDKKHLIFDITKGAKSGLIQGKTIPLGVGIAGWVAEKEEALLIPDAYQDKRFNPEYDRQTGFRTRSILAVPLMLHNQLIGVVQLLNRVGGGGFEQRDLGLLEQFSNYLSIAIHNARLYENLLSEKQQLTEALDRLRETMERERLLRIENERMESELEIAREIQASMLPRTFPPFPDRKEFDIFATMVPAREVGGDFYDFFMVDERRLCVVIGDVSGKGVPAALFMVIAKTLLKTVALGGASPDKTLFEVNNLLFADNPTSMFVTVFVGILDVRTGEFQFANGGHNPPLFCGGEGPFRFLDMPQGAIVGPVENMSFQPSRIVFSPGDTLYIYTDGVSEAMNPDNELFTSRRLAEVLNALKDKTVGEIVSGVSDSIHQFIRGAEPSDDITQIALRYKGPI